jgi:transcriptional regulator with XRE-family HTH domain
MSLTDVNTHPVAARLAGLDALPEQFTDWLRYWRKRRGMSQLALSAYSGISQRHISFLESGRSQPSREMVLKLGNSLDIPLRQRNSMLVAAGFAPLYKERALDDPDLLPAYNVLSMMIEQHDPYPATIVDRLWNIVGANQSAIQMMNWLLGPPDTRSDSIAGINNALLLTLHPDGMRPYIRNFEPIAIDLLDAVRREARTQGPGGQAATDLLEQLAALPDLPAALSNPVSEAGKPVQTLEVVKDGIELQLITTVASLGVAREITLDDLRVELIFPANETSAQQMKRLKESQS